MLLFNPGDVYGFISIQNMAVKTSSPFDTIIQTTAAMLSWSAADSYWNANLYELSKYGKCQGCIFLSCWNMWDGDRKNINTYWGLCACLFFYNILVEIFQNMLVKVEKCCVRRTVCSVPLEGTLDLECLAGCQNLLFECSPTCMLMLSLSVCHFVYLEHYFIYLPLVSDNNIS